jgi:hypothetical protein
VNLHQKYLKLYLELKYLKCQGYQEHLMYLKCLEYLKYLNYLELLEYRGLPKCLKCLGLLKYQ